MAEKKTKEKNIYEKMAAVKTKMLGIKKGGKNDFSHYSYFELGDILPVLTPALKEARLFMQTQFSATEQIAKLIIIDIDNTESRVEFEIRFAECNLKEAHEIQNLGAAQTYTRRYLIMTAFDIAEADLVDAGEGSNEKPKKKPETQTAQNASKPTQQNKPQADAPKPPDPLQGLKREAYELIKRLPKDQQALWISSCQSANEAILNEVINKVHAILYSQQESPEPTAPQEQAQKQPAKEELDIF